MNQVNLVGTKDCELGEIIGILFQFKNATLEATRQLWKEETLKYAKEHGWDGSKPFLALTMPCGKSVIYEKFDDIPEVDVPCSCGNPKHWFIKYTKLLKEDKNG